ncbi:hypothetical protein FRC00_013087 [Tulasnella sp. 408]|nr:hypothetical protein FRC00_013087 [Tulasnella sp. 408]
MQTSPFLEADYIRLSAPVAKPAPPPGFFRAPKGRRRRGGTDHGEGLGAGFEPHGQLWNWLLLLQVKEGTEGRGAVEYVAKLARNLIIKENPGFHVPSKGTTKSRGTSEGWAMLDLGDHAIHVISKSAREKWFSDYYLDSISLTPRLSEEKTPGTLSLNWPLQFFEPFFNFFVLLKALLNPPVVMLLISAPKVFTLFALVASTIAAPQASVATSSVEQSRSTKIRTTDAPSATLATTTPDLVTLTQSNGIPTEITAVTVFNTVVSGSRIPVTSSFVETITLYPENVSHPAVTATPAAASATPAVAVSQSAGAVTTTATPTAAAQNGALSRAGGGMGLAAIAVVAGVVAAVL